ncbi:MAG: helix-turn-helix transcriptional regulator [Bacteroidetes bacterium]|nr:helix-turn-helix transcriptional regulator [Bacteroidota bacterium]
MDKEEKRTFYLELGKRITKHRKKAGLKQESLASLISLSRTSMINIEKGRQQPSIYLLCEIANHLNVTVTALVPKLIRSDEIRPDWKKTIDTQFGNDSKAIETMNRFLFDVKTPK